MIKITIEIREVEGSVTAKRYATPAVTATELEHNHVMWLLREFDKIMTDSGATEAGKKENN